MKPFLLFILSLVLLSSCQKESITIELNVSETFYVENNGASMHVLVEGNTESKTFLVFVHGGPGTPCLGYNTKYISENIENRYATVYWDQRNAGASQGNSNGDKLNLNQMTDDSRKLILVLKQPTKILAFDPVQLNIQVLRKFLDDLVKSNMGTILEHNNIKKKPIQIIHDLKIQKSVEFLKDKIDRSLGEEVLQHLSEITIYLNNKCNLHCESCEYAYKQVSSCKKGRNESE